MKIQDSSFNGLKVTVGTKSVTHARTHALTDAPKAICPINFFKVGGIKSHRRRLDPWFRSLSSHVPAQPIHQTFILAADATASDSQLIMEPQTIEHTIRPFSPQAIRPSE